MNMHDSTQDKSPVSAESLRELTSQKEKEWRDLQQLSISSLEAALGDRDRQLSEEKIKFQKLKEDFKYNLKLLSERDAELDNYDSSMAKLRCTLSTKEAELSQLKIKIDDLQKGMELEGRSRDEMQSHYQQRLREKIAEMEEYRRAKDEEINKERHELAALKNTQQMALQEAEHEVDTQRRELSAGFDEALRKREHEFRIKMDEMSSNVLAHQLKEKLLIRELEAAKALSESSVRETQDRQAEQCTLEKALKQREWQLTDVTATKDARISELEAKLHEAEQRRKRLEEDFKRKYADMDRSVREKQAALVKMKEAGEERENKLQGVVRDAESQLETYKVKLRQLEWTNEDVKKDKQSKVETLESEIARLKGQWERQIAEMSRDNVARDIEFETLRQTNVELRAEIAQKKEDIQRYQKDLETAVERNVENEKRAAQLELDWQRRLESVEREQYDKSENLVKGLTKVRDQALADLHAKEKELEHQQAVMKVLATDRDKALATLKQHGLTTNVHIDLSQFTDLPESSAAQLRELNDQNENLRVVIRQMRHQMETLGKVMPTEMGEKTEKSYDVHAVSEEYVKTMEEEVMKLKSDNRVLQLQKQDHEKSSADEDVSEKIKMAAGDNTVILSHVEKLNNEIGSLRSEKVSLVAQLRKQQGRMQHLQTQLDELTEQPRLQQVALDQARYALGAETRRQAVVVAELTRARDELATQLTEARRETDTYSQACIEANAKCTQLSGQVSALKLELAQGRPTVNFGAQELMIQQLQDEIRRLTEHHQNLVQCDDEPSMLPGTTQQLQGKLRDAVKRIGRLTREKQQLIEMGNHLRSQLNAAGIRDQPSLHKAPPSSQPVDVWPVYSGGLSTLIQGKLGQLEKMQYQLTKQELAYAQRKAVAMTTDSTPHRVDTTGCSVDESTGRVRSASNVQSSHHIPNTTVPQSCNPPATAQSPSSVGSESLREIWGMLDNDTITTPLPSARCVTQATPRSESVTDKNGKAIAPVGHSDFMVSGQSAQLQKATTQRPVNKPGVARKAKIRNYNIKEDWKR